MNLLKKHEQIRKELRSQVWSLIDTTRYLINENEIKIGEDDLRKRIDFFKNSGLISSKHKVTREIPEVLNNYKRFIDRIIKKYLYDEPLCLAYIELRHHEK